MLQLPSEPKDVIVFVSLKLLHGSLRVQVLYPSFTTVP